MGSKIAELPFSTLRALYSSPKLYLCKGLISLCLGSARALPYLSWHGGRGLANGRAYAVPVLPRSRVDVESPPEYLLHSDGNRIATLHRFYSADFIPCGFHGRFVKDGRITHRRELAMKQSDSETLLAGSLEHHRPHPLGSHKV